MGLGVLPMENIIRWFLYQQGQKHLLDPRVQRDPAGSGSGGGGSGSAAVIPYEPYNANTMLSEWPLSDALYMVCAIFRSCDWRLYTYDILCHQFVVNNSYSGTTRRGYIY